MTPDKQPPEPGEFDRFRDLAQRLVKVPKTEIDAERKSKTASK